MIIHDSRKESFRRPFGAAEVSAAVTLAAECPGAAEMTLRLHRSGARTANSLPSSC